MDDAARVDQMAERLRQEPYDLLRNDCITKSFRLKHQCAQQGIPARVAICIGLARAKLLGREVTLPVIHAWVEVDRVRIETSRPIGASGTWGIVPASIRPVIKGRL
jgi:hypothetical protein